MILRAREVVRAVCVRDPPDAMTGLHRPEHSFEGRASRSAGATHAGLSAAHRRESRARSYDGGLSASTDRTWSAAERLSSIGVRAKGARDISAPTRIGRWLAC